VLSCFAIPFLQSRKKEHNKMMEALGELEQAALTAVLLVGEGAYGVLVHERMQSLLARKMSLGSVSTVLDRLENKGLVSSTYGDPTPERGGRAKRFFQVEAAGERALRASLRRSAALASALEAV
jgi:PadR family transcriptional regulator PadR